MVQGLGGGYHQAGEAHGERGGGDNNEAAVYDFSLKLNSKCPFTGGTLHITKPERTCLRTT